MGINFKIEAGEGIIYSMAEGTIRLEDIQVHRKSLLADPKFHPDLVEIFEYRLSRFKFTEDEAKTLASTVPALHARKVALVADGSNRELALRYKEWVREKILVEVFTDLGSAKVWVTSD